ncbi:MAG: Ribose transport system permease protein RbsC [Tenericutes bacterium ADurb.Bin239]|nr:MAG: Ribose transport system permease protein RbsC [Tenericutes bacterium ADurb.Bin239]
MLKFIFSEQFLISTILFATPILFASFAALISKKAGILNINVEGTMSLSALAGGLVSYATKSWFVGLLAAVVTGIIMNFIFAAFSMKLKTDKILTGIALNTLASGLSIYVLYAVIGVKGDSSLNPSVLIPNINIPLLSKIPIIGKAIFGQNLLVYVAIIAVILIIFLLNRTKLGMHIKAVGHNEEAAKSVSIKVNQIKIIALIITGLFAGLGGAYLSMVYLSYFSAGMVAGRGFIGIAAEAMGQGKPLLTLLFALLFGAVDYFAVGSQTVLSFPYELLNTLPYLMTIIALVIFAVIKKYGTNKINQRSKDDETEKV